MTFSILAVRTGEEPASTLYPDPGDSPNTVELDPADGEIQTFTASGLSVVSLAGARPKQLAKFADIELALILTDQRVTVACSKYDKGGGRSGFGVGGLAIAVTANAVSKARAKRRSKGKTLVGQVRHDWLGQIEAKDRSGMFGKNSLELLLGDPTTPEAELLVLSITLGKREPATSIAADIATRAALYKAAHVADQHSQPDLLTYAQHPTYETLGGGTRRYRLPEASA